MDNEEIVFVVHRSATEDVACSQLPISSSAHALETHILQHSAVSAGGFGISIMLFI